MSDSVTPPRVEKVTTVATLGNSSRVSVDPKTIVTAQKPLTMGQKRKLRQEAILAYIKSRPYGQIIKIEEFQAAGDFKGRTYADVFVKKMLRSGLITREEVVRRRYAYFAPAAKVKVTKPADSIALPSKPPEFEDSSPPAKISQYKPGEIELLAMKFSWEHQEEHNDLRKFIDWLKTNTK